MIGYELYLIQKLDDGGLEALLAEEMDIHTISYLD